MAFCMEENVSFCTNNGFNYHESIGDWIHEMYIFVRNFRPMQLNCIIWAIVRVCNTQSGEQYSSGVYARQMYMTHVSFV